MITVIHVRCEFVNNVVIDRTVGLLIIFRQYKTFYRIQHVILIDFVRRRHVCDWAKYETICHDCSATAYIARTLRAIGN